MASKKQKKNKGKTISLQEFTASLDTTSAGQNVIYTTKQVPKSWADEVDDDEYADAVISNKVKVILPSAPRASRGPDFNEADIPHVPPFKAHMGNISFDIDEGDIYSFFKDLEVTELRLPRDGNNRLRGFGYVQFKTREQLIEALRMNEQPLNGRPVRITVGHEGEGGDRRGGGGGRNAPDQTPDDWRSAPQTQLDAPPPRSEFQRRNDYNSDFGGRPDYGSRGGRGGDGGGNRYDNQRGYEGGSDQGGGFRGGDYGRRGGDYGDRDRGRNFGGHRDGRRDGPPGGGESDEEGPWRRNPEPRPDAAGQQGQGRPFRQDPRDREGDSCDRRYGSRSREISPDFSDIRRDPREPRPPRRQTPSPNKDDTSFRGPRRSPPPRREPRNPSPPRERKRLVLAPRTVAESASDTVVASSTIFGGARPVDTASREREIEKKLEAEQSVGHEEPRRVRILQRPRFEETKDHHTPPPRHIPRQLPSDSSLESAAPQPSNAWTDRRERQEVLSTRELEETRQRHGGRGSGQDAYEDDDGSSTVSRDHQQSPHPDSDHKDTNSEPEDERDLRRQRELKHDEEDFHKVERRRKSKPTTEPPLHRPPPSQMHRGGRGGGGGASRGGGSTHRGNY